MIKLMKTRAGEPAKGIYEYPENWNIKDASEILTRNYREELSNRDDTMYVSSLQEELNLLNEGAEFYDYDLKILVKDEDIIKENEKYVDNIDWRGAGYYSIDGDCLLLDDELKTYIHEDVWTWELKEFPNRKEEDYGY